MTQAKHTPGPWHAVKSSSNGWEIRGVLGAPPECRNMVEFSYSSDKPVLLFLEPWHQFPNAEWDEMQEANARLIAAAPELLEALQVMTALCLAKYGNMDSDVYSEIEKANTAIAKATCMATNPSGGNAL